MMHALLLLLGNCVLKFNRLEDAGKHLQSARVKLCA
jgi:hypothetical protein